MKNFMYLLSGLAAVAAYLLMTRSHKTTQSVDELAHKLESAWADHHTVA